MPPAASLSERLRLPRHRNPGSTRFLPCRRDDGELDADRYARRRVLRAENPPRMLLQDALARAQPQIGESFRVSGIGRERSKGLDSACCGTGIGDADDGNFVFSFPGDRQSSAILLAYRMQSVIDDLHADLEQLVGISADEKRLRWECGAYLDL